MSGAKEFVLVCLVLLVISCLTSAQPATQENSEWACNYWRDIIILIVIVIGSSSEITDVYDQFRKREQQSVDDLTQLNQAPRMSRSVKYAPYLVSGEVSSLPIFSVLAPLPNLNIKIIINIYRTMNAPRPRLFQSQFIEKVNQKAIRSPSLRLRFGRRNDPDFPPNFVSI